MAHRQSIGALLLTLSLVSPAALAFVAPADLPTLESLQKQFDDGDYQGVVRESSRLAALKRDAAAAIDRYAVLSLKGEAHLRLKQFQPASKAFADAADEPSASPEQKNIALAMALLSRKSTAAGYQAAGRGDAINILKPENRKAAFLQLFEAELAPVTKALEKAKKSASLPALTTAAGGVRELRGLEMAASDSDEKTKALLVDVAESTVASIDGTVETMSRRTEDLFNLANEENRQQRRNKDGTFDEFITKRGLDSRNQAELKTMIRSCEELVPMLAKLGTALDDQAAPLKSVEPKVEALYARAKEVLKYDYHTRVMR